MRNFTTEYADGSKVYIREYSKKDLCKRLGIDPDNVCDIVYDKPEKCLWISFKPVQDGDDV